MSSPLDILNTYWGFTSFKPKQEEIIDAILKGMDTVALLPTGGGKSVCFQIPALQMEGICIVVSPLVALIEDQVNVLKQKGIKALSISGGISFTELRTLLDNATFGNYKFLYLSPERLQQDMVQQAIKLMNVNSIAVDEAHCISQWGNDFRPAYKNIVVLRDLHPLAPIIALTATATPEVLEDTIAELKLELPAIFKNSFVRSRLSYQVLVEQDKLYRLEQLLKNNRGSAIVYVRSRSATLETSKHLSSLGISATFYHGGISKEDKTKRLNDWKNGQVSTMVATNAFGMGIDHATVRYVIHLQLPESLESYFQEAGRAGRDNDYASAIILFNDHDKTIAKKQFIDALAGPKELKTLYKKLNNYFHISYGEGEFTEHNFSFTDFCKTYHLNASLTYNGLNSLDRLGIIQLSTQFGRKSKLKFLIASEAIMDYFKKDPSLAVIGKTILRLYGGIFEAATAISLDLIVSKTGQSIDQIISVLERMEKDAVVELALQTTDASLTFLVPREDDKTINVVAKDVDTLNRKKNTQLDAVINYVTNTAVCRSLQLVTYFGETTSEACGICSVCASQASTVNKTELKLISEKILLHLENSALSSREISETLTFTEAKILKVLQLLMESGKIKINTKNQYYLS